MSTPLKAFFQAGLDVEEAIEVKNKSREVLRAACADKCPIELSEYDKTEEALSAAKKRFADVWMSMHKDYQNTSHAMLHAQGGDCGDDKCPFKPTSAGAATDAGKMN